MNTYVPASDYKDRPCVARISMLIILCISMHKAKHDSADPPGAALFIQ